MSWQYGVGDNENHAAACAALRSKLGWTTAEGYPVMIGGDLPDGRMAWVFASGDKVEN